MESYPGSVRSGGKYEEKAMGEGPKKGKDGSRWKSGRVGTSPPPQSQPQALGFKRNRNLKVLNCLV